MFTEVFVNVHAWDDSRIGAVLVDRGGLRTGWATEGQLREIVGCGLGFGTEEGVPYPEGQAEDTSAATADTSDATAGESEPPKYVYFHIGNDAVTPFGLIDQGGCELRLDPIVAGKVQLGLSANRAGSILCQDSTSVWVTPGVPLRYRLSWKADRNICVARVARLGEDSSRKGQPKRGR